jgi:hypothetical protein
MTAAFLVRCDTKKKKEGKNNWRYIKAKGFHGQPEGPVSRCRKIG